MPGRAANAGTISSIGAPRNMPASARAHMVGSISTAIGMPPRPKSGRKPGSQPVEAGGDGLVSDDVLTREERSDEFLLMGLRLAEGIDIARYRTIAGRPLDPARIAMLHEHGLVETTAEGGCGSPCRASRCSMRWWPISLHEVESESKASSLFNELAH